VLTSLTDEWLLEIPDVSLLVERLINGSDDVCKSNDGLVYRSRVK